MMFFIVVNCACSGMREKDDVVSLVIEKKKSFNKVCADELNSGPWLNYPEPLHSFMSF